MNSKPKNWSGVGLYHLDLQEPVTDTSHMRDSCNTIFHGSEDTLSGTENIISLIQLQHKVKFFVSKPFVSLQQT